MSDTEKMLEYFEGLRQTQDGEYYPRTKEDKTKDRQFSEAIRARLLAYDKLEKNYTELLGKIKTLQNITKEAEESGGYYIWLRKMLFVAKSIRDHREGK